METSTILILLGAAALGGGAYYLYKSGKLVGDPGMSQGAPQQSNIVTWAQPKLQLSGYGYPRGYSY